MSSVLSALSPPVSTPAAAAALSASSSNRKNVWSELDFGRAAEHTQFLPVSTGPYQVTAGDLNGDGHPDLVVTCRGELLLSTLKHPANDKITVYLNHQPGGEWERRDFPVGFGPYAAAIGDLDGDGLPDVAVANFQSNDGRDLAILWGSKNRSELFEPTQYIKMEGDFPPNFPYTADGTPIYASPGLTGVAFTDVDGDGRLDIIVVAFQANCFIVLLNQGNRKFKQVRYPMQPSPYNVVLAGPRDIALADFDGDGITDLAFTLYESNIVHVWRNDGKGHFTFWRQSQSYGWIPYHLKAADLDGDGRPDIVVGNRSFSDNVVVLRNGPDAFTDAGSFTPGTPHYREQTVDQIRDVFLTDLDHDGKLDLIAACHLSNKVVFWKGTGNLAYNKAFIDRQIVEFPGKGPRCIARLPNALAIVFYDSSEVGIMPLPTTS